MATKATLKLGSKEYNLLSCDYSVSSSTDHTGRPSSQVMAGMINFSVESTVDVDIFGWACDWTKFQDGSVTFYKRDADSKLRELEFKKAAVVSFSESFSAFGGDSMTTSFTISCDEIGYGSTKHENKWAI